MSSQTQPQKVQVAFSTILSSGMCSSSSTFAWSGNSELFANLTDQARLDLAVSGYSRWTVICWVEHGRVVAAFALEGASVLSQVLQKLSSFHREALFEHIA